MLYSFDFHELLHTQGFTLLKLANPHGTGCDEWGGTWSNTDTKSWKDNPEVGTVMDRVIMSARLLPPDRGSPQPTLSTYNVILLAGPAPACQHRPFQEECRCHLPVATLVCKNAVSHHITACCLSLIAPCNRLLRRASGQAAWLALASSGCR